MTLARASLVTLLSALLGLPLGCQQEAESPPGPRGDGDLGGAGGGDGDGVQGDGDAGDGDAASGEGDGDLPAPRCGVDEEPGTELMNLESEGRGRCASVSVAEFVSEIRAQNPELAEVTEMHAEVSDGDSVSYYLAFIQEDGGLRAVFQQGRGDCSSGCIDNVFHYFAAGDSCQPVLVGSYSSVQNYEENCRERSGDPMWGYPVASPTANACDPPEGPALEGTFEVPFTGRHQACSAGGDAPVEPVSGTLELTLRPLDETGEVTVLLGSPSLDAPWLETTEFSATVDYLQVSVETLWDNTPTMCLESHSLSMNLDLEVCFVGHLAYEEALDTACDGDLCKGSLTLDLDLSSLRTMLEER
jgi:hypothetical protein